MGKTGWTVTGIVVLLLVVGGVIAAISSSKKKNREYNLVYEQSPL